MLSDRSWSGAGVVVKWSWEWSSSGLGADQSGFEVVLEWP